MNKSDNQTETEIAARRRTRRICPTDTRTPLKHTPRNATRQEMSAETSDEKSDEQELNRLTRLLMGTKAKYESAAGKAAEKKAEIRQIHAEIHAIRVRLRDAKKKRHAEK